MEEKSIYRHCTDHDNQYLMYLKTTFPKLEQNEIITNKHLNKCSYCLISSQVDVNHYTIYNTFKDRISKKYRQMEEIKQLYSEVLAENEQKKNDSKYKKMYQIQKQITQTIETNLIQCFEQCRSEFDAMNSNKCEYSQQFLEIFNLKIIIEFDEFFFYELLQQSIHLLTKFDLLINFKSATKPFSVSKNFDLKIKRVSFQKDKDFPNQSIKSNLMKFQEKIFIFGDNIGYIYYYNTKTNAQLQQRYHTNQICVIEKLTEDTFCSGAQDNKVITYKIDPKDKLGIISQITMPYQVFRVRKIDNKRIAVNQNSTVVILNLSKKQSFVEKKLSFPGKNNDIFGILYINKQIVALHRDGRLNFWDWKKGIIVRSHCLSKLTSIQLGDLQVGEVFENELENFIEEDEDFVTESNNEDDIMQEEIEEEESNSMNIIAHNQDDNEEWQTDESDSFDIEQHVYSRVRLLGKSKIAAVSYANMIKIIDYNDFYFTQPPLKINVQYDLLCLESIPKTDLVLIAGKYLDIYNLNKQKMEITIENDYNEVESNDGLEDEGFQFGSEGLIGGAIYNQSQIVSIKSEELELIFVQL